MTREEQTDWLCRLRADLNNGVIFTPWNKEFTEALTGILEQEPCEDAISRQATFNLMRGLTRWCVKSEDGKWKNVGLLYDDVMFGIDSLPSVTPQHTNAEIQKMQELEQAEIQKAYELGKAEMQSSDDAISRQAVIDLAEWFDLNQQYFTVANLIDKVENIPSVTPQQKTDTEKETGWWKAFTHSAYHGNDEDGEPIWREVTVYHCNLCNRRTVIKEKYCPSCGAKMQEVENG